MKYTALLVLKEELKSINAFTIGREWRKYFLASSERLEEMSQKVWDVRTDKMDELVTEERKVKNI